MIEAPSLLLAFAAGLISFVSPCCLPLVPGYLAAIAPSGERPSRRIDPAIIGRSLIFIGSFSLVFILLGASTTAIGSLLGGNILTLRRVAGVAIIAMGLFLLASIVLTSLNRDFRPTRLIERAGRGGPALVGIAFAIAWTPCVGPTLGAILSLAATEQSTAGAAGLLAVYSAGLGVPFLASAIGFSALERRLEWVKRHYNLFQATAGLILIVLGVLVYTNELFLINIQIQRFLDQFDLNFFQSV